MSDARGRRERLYHPEGGHTSTELDIITEPAARALAIARIEAEAEDARREAERLKIARWERRRRELVAEAKIRAREELQQRTEPRLCPPPPKLRDVINAVSKFYGVSVVDIISQRKTARVVRPRQVFCYLARVITTRSFPEIGRHLGNRDHTSILHSFNKIAILVATDAQLAADVAAIRTTLEGPS